MNKLSRNEVLEIVTITVSDILNKPGIPINQPLDEVGMNSLKTIRLVVQLEKKMDMIFENSDLLPDNWATIDNIVQLIMKEK